MRVLPIYFLYSVCLTILLSSQVFSQHFQTGLVADSLEQHGRLKFYAPNLDSVEQINRTSVLVGTGMNTVFDFEKDAQSLIAPSNITIPEWSDYEIMGVIDNGGGASQPDVTVRQNIYGWSITGYTIIQYTVINNQSTDINATIGIEIVPKLNGEFGDEIVEYISNPPTISIRKSTSYVGYRWLSADLVSLASFAYYQGYNAADLYLWQYLNYGQFDVYFDPGPIGAVCIPSQAAVPIPAGDSTTVWIAMGYGHYVSQMLERLSEAEDMYSTLSVSDNYSNGAPVTFKLMQNYPNPFNPGTTISYVLDSRQFVSLLLFNSAGEQMGTLVRSEKNAGIHKVEFDGSNFASGIYYYMLNAGNNSSTRKMMLVK